MFGSYKGVVMKGRVLPAGVVACVALFFSLAGVALAAGQWSNHSADGGAAKRQGAGWQFTVPAGRVAATGDIQAARAKTTTWQALLGGATLTGLASDNASLYLQVTLPPQSDRPDSYIVWLYGGQARFSCSPSTRPEAAITLPPAARYTLALIHRAGRVSGLVNGQRVGSCQGGAGAPTTDVGLTVMQSGGSTPAAVTVTSVGAA